RSPAGAPDAPPAARVEISWAEAIRGRDAPPALFGSGRLSMGSGDLSSLTVLSAQGSLSAEGASAAAAPEPVREKRGSGEAATADDTSIWVLPPPSVTCLCTDRRPSRASMSIWRR